jgi:hypothetical protein
MSDLDHAIAELKRFRLHVARQLARLDGELLEYARASYRRAEKTHERIVMDAADEANKTKN